MQHPSASHTSTLEYNPLDSFHARPRLSEQRPHTVHASSSANGSASSIEDDDITPRASAAGPSSLRNFSARRRLSRDDTANDLHYLEAEAYGLAWHGEGVPPHMSEEEHKDLTEQMRRRTSRKIFYGPPAASPELGKTPSFSRRLSKYSRERVNGLREITQRYTNPVTSRGRRSSTPFDYTATSAHGTIDPTVLSKPPTSPSKRAAKHDVERPRKHRSIFSSAADRKDTPAPASTSNTFGQPLAWRPAVSRPTPNMGIARGGDAARKAAALHNYHLLDAESTRYYEDEDIILRRSRLGSLSSAADSGADLSNYGSEFGSPRPDFDGDIDMCNGPHGEHDHLLNSHDFTRRFPEELSLLVFQYLEATDLANAEAVNRKWNSMASDTSVWRTVFLNRFIRHVTTDPPPVQVGGYGIGRPNKANQEWKRMYRARVALEKNWRAGADDAGKAVYLSGHTDSVYCLQFDEEKIITGSRDRTIRVWDINTYQCMRVIGGPSVKPVIGPKVLRTVDYPSFHMATASVNGTAHGDSIYHVPREWHDASILCLQYDEEILVTGSSDSDLLIWDIKTYEPIKRLSKHHGGVLDVALDAKHIVSCSKDSRIIVWDRNTLEPKGELTGHRGPVNAVQLRGHLLVSASGDGIARLWDLNQMKLIKEFSAKERGLAAVEFSEDMKYVLAGGNDNITYKFETDTGREVMQFTGHSQLVRSLWLDSGNNRVVSGSYDLDLRVYDFISGQELWRGEEWTTSWMLAAKSDYRRIVATSQDGRILIVDFGIYKAAPTYKSRDGEHIEDIDLLRGIEHTNEIKFTNPFESRARRSARSY